MGYVPDDAEWFLAYLVIQMSVEGDRRKVVHINYCLVAAKTAEEAYQKALKLGRQHNSVYRNIAGKKVVTKFLGLRELDVIHDKLEHGCEIMYREIVDASPKEIAKLTCKKGHLGVFAPRVPTEGPDYASGSVMRRLKKYMETNSKPKQKSPVRKRAKLRVRHVRD